MTDFGNSIRLELANRESAPSRVSFIPENFASDASLSASSRREIASLSAETDPELLARGLLSWAGREERQQNFAAASAAYQFIGEHGSNLGISAEARATAQDRLAVLNGAGSVGARVEYQLSRFVHEASNPAFLGAMATGSAVFSGGRAAILSQLASSGRAVIGARFLATAGAFSLEVPSVWITAKGITELMAPGRQSWSADQNLRELAGLGLTLGAFKFCSGAVGRVVAPEAGAIAANNSAARSAIVQTAAFGGLVLGRQLEVATGLRAKTDIASTAIDSLALLLQAQVGGRVAQSSLGPKFQARSRALEDVARQGESVAWSRLTTTLRGQGPDMVFGQGPDMVFGQGPDMIRPEGQAPDMVYSRAILRGQGPDMISGQGPDMVFGQGPDMIQGQGPDMRTALQ